MRVERVIDLVAYLIGIEILGREQTNAIIRRNPLYRASYKGTQAFGKTHAEAIVKLFQKYVFDISMLELPKDGSAKP
jgi:hypothetical protein